jgi:hypothetical protein
MPLVASPPPERTLLHVVSMLALLDQKHQFPSSLNLTDTQGIKHVLVTGRKELGTSY